MEKPAVDAEKIADNVVDVNQYTSTPTEAESKKCMPNALRM